MPRGRKAKPDPTAARRTLKAIMPGAVRVWREQRDAARAYDEYVKAHPELGDLWKRQVEAMSAANEVGSLVHEHAEAMEPVRRRAFYDALKKPDIDLALMILEAEWKPEEVPDEEPVSGKPPLQEVR